MKISNDKLHTADIRKPSVQTATLALKVPNLPYENMVTIRFKIKKSNSACVACFFGKKNVNFV